MYSHSFNTYSYLWIYIYIYIYIHINHNNAHYGEGNEYGTTVKFETQVIKSNLCDSSDAYILVTGDITATGAYDNARIALKIVLHLRNASLT